MFGTKAGDLWRWCGLAAAVTLLTLCVLLLSSQAIMAEGGSFPAKVSFSAKNAVGESRDGSPQPNPDYTVDLTYDAVWGMVDAGSTVTVTRSVGGGAYGACQADGVGFCWTALYDSSGNGRPVDIVGDDTLLVYKGGLDATIVPLTITGEIDVLGDEVDGNVTGTATLPFSVTVTLGDFGYMVTDAPRVTATVDANGDFSADFGDAGVDIGAHEMAQVQYQDASGNTVQGYVYPSGVFRVDNWEGVNGYAEPGTQVTVTVYESYPDTERWSDSDVWADWPHGTYKTGGEIGFGDVAEVELSGGTMMSVTAEAIRMWVDATTDQVTGTAPVGAPVRGYVWSSFQDEYEIVTDTATGGDYTLQFVLDLDPRYWVYVAYADDEGDEVGIAAPPAHIRAAPQFQYVAARADGPEQAITYTLDLGEEITTTTVGCGPTNGCEGWEGELDAGDIITAELESGLTMVMTVADLSAELDTANDRMLGRADIAGDIEANAWQWNGDRYPMNGDVYATATAASPFTATFSNFDIRDGMGGWWFAHFADNGGHRTFFANMHDGQWETPHFEVGVPWGVGGIRPVAGEVITAELWTKYGGELVESTSNGENDENEWRFWRGFDGPRIRPGNWITVTSASGWSAGLEVPTLTLEIDGENNLMFGEAPKSSVWLHHRWGEGDEDWAGYWVPVDGYVLDTGFFGHELNRYDQKDVTYQAPSGNRVRVEGVWPQLFVDYGADWVQANYPVDHTFVVTASDPISDFVAVRDSEWGGGWWAPSGFRTEGEDWADERPDIVPDYEVEFVADDGYSQTITVGTITGTLDLEDNSISGEIYAPWFGGDLDVQCHPDTWWDEAFEYSSAAADGTSSYYCKWDDKEIVDLSNLDDPIMVTYVEPDTGNWVSNRFREYGVQIQVNYAHDWVEIRTEPFAEVTVIVEGKGMLVGTADGQGDMASHWYQDDWSQGNPDFEPGDRITATAIGKMATIDPVGTIDGEVDRSADVVSGTIQAPFGDTELRVRCEVWTENGPPGIEFDDISANGGEFECDFSGEYDIQFEDTVSVRYYEPDGDQVIRSFDEPRPNMRVEKWSEGGGQVMPGGPAVFGIQVSNDGQADAEGVVLTDTLPGNTDWFTDSSGFPAGFDTGVVTWHIGPVAVDEQIRFQLVLTPNSPPWSGGSTLDNRVDVYAPYDDDDGNNGAEASVDVSDDSEDAPDLYVNKNSSPGDPYPDDAFLWEINYGNQGPVASGPVVLTDTLVAGTEVITWYSNDGYSLWTDESTPGEFVLKAPTLPGNWGDRIMLWLEVDSGVQPGSTLSNTVEITTAGDTYTDNNRYEDYDVHVSDGSRRDVYVEKRFNGGSLVPGQEMEYGMHLSNHGNRTVEVSLVDTLPDGVSFHSASMDMGNTRIPFPPDSQPEGQVVWDDSIGELLPGEWMNINIRLSVDGDAEVGSPLTNCVEATIDGYDDDRPSDNESCVVDRVSAPGTNIRVRKEYNWDDYDRLRCDLYVENIGTSTIEDLEITDIWPDGIKDIEWYHGHGPSFEEVSRINQELVLELGDDQILDRGNTARVEVHLILDSTDPGQTFVNRVEAPLDGDNDTSDNWAEVTAITGPDIYAEKWLSDGEPRPGEVATFTVAFGNQNRWPWHTADEADVHITDTLPAGMTFVAATDPDNPSQPWDPADQSGDTVVWDWGQMGSEDRREFSLVVEFDASLQGGDVLTNTVEAYGDGPNNVEAVYDNNIFKLPVTLLGPGFDVTKTYQSSRAAGGPVTYTLTVENVGNEDGTQVVLADTLPTGVTYGSSDGVKSGDDITWTFAKIAPAGKSTGWFMGTLSCTTGDVSNSGYGVTGSDQGITTGSGTPVVFSVIAPTLAASFSQSASAINLGDKVDFADTSTTNGGDIVAWGWDFGDGNTGTGATASHTYDMPGTFDVTLTVTDGCGYSDDVTVAEAVTIGQINVYLPAIFKNH